ncbi:glycosyltransferase family 4 protein [Qipengyuania citrea]|uniref:glycosyltransferase family 4 protein n=1 Tax=Qipengyuania citrea TaxID=225971 RepID=UPI003299353F
MFEEAVRNCASTKCDLLIISLDYPPNDGGISRLASGMVGALQEAGLHIHVITSAAEGRLGLARPASEYTEVRRCKGLRDVGILLAIRRHFQTFGSGIPILTTVWNPEATLALLAGSRRVIVLAHGNEVMRYRYRGLKAIFRRFVLERAKVVVCNSRFTQDLVRQIAPAARTTVLNPSVDADQFCSPLPSLDARKRLGLPIKKRIILTIARLDPVKGHDTVLRAMARLNKEELEQLHYVIIGKGEMEDHLVNLAKELELESCVEFAGFQPDAALRTWFGAANLFVLPSVLDLGRQGMEGFGMAFTEAQAAGLPVIGTRSGGIPDAIAEGEGGWLIAERDDCALAEHFRMLISDPSAFVEQGKLGAMRVRRDMTWQDYARRLVDLI